MKRFTKGLALIITCALFGLMPATAMAQDVSSPKEEVVYANLQVDGSPAGAYVVNSFDMQSAGHIVDFGNYDSVTNLTTTDTLQNQDGEVSGDVPAGRFYYQGNLSRVQLPWAVSVGYQLNGNPVNAASLANANGSLKINMKITDATGADEVFTKNYMLQTTMTFDTEKCSNITAEGATVANSGKNKAVSFAKLPGKDADYTVSMDVKNFEMAGIQIAAVPLNMDIGDFDTSGLTGGLKQLQDGISSLDSGANDLSSGAQQLNEGSGSLTQGLQQFQGGLGSIQSGLASLVAGNPGWQQGSQQILDGLKSIQGNMAAISDGISQTAGGLASLKSSFSAADSAIASAPGSPYASLHQANADTITQLTAQINALTAADPAANAAQIQQLTQIKNLLGANDGLISGLKTGIVDGVSPNPGLADGMAALNSGMAQLKDGIDKLASNYASFNDGIVKYTNGTQSLYEGYAQLCDGFNKIVQGSAQLSAGISSFTDGSKQYTGGVDEMHDQTKNMDSDMQKQIDDMMKTYTGGDFTPVSFVSDKNTNVKSVQFVMMTEEIKIEKPQAVQQQPAVQDFWDRLIALFGIHK